MKKGFTMIELIFVIVILGILAAVAIPRLSATRDDAELAKAATNLSTAVSDITAYYTAKAGFGDKVIDMTNVSLRDDTNSSVSVTGHTVKSGAVLELKKKGCINIAVVDSAENNTTHEIVPAFVNVSAVASGSDALCGQFKKIDSVKKLLDAEPVYGKEANGTALKLPKGSYPVGGSNIVF